MRKYLFILSAFSCIHYLSAQPLSWTFPDSGMVWNQGQRWGSTFETSGGTDHQIYPNGSDTIIGGIPYVKLFHSGRDFTNSQGHILSHESYFYHQLFGYFRNDTLNESVELICVWNGGNNVVTYDFDLSIGDTISLSVDLNQAVVTAIDSIYMGGLSRKVFHYEDVNEEFLTDYWIEGIGPHSGLTEHLFSSSLDYSASMDCISINDTSYSFINSYLPQYTNNDCGKLLDGISIANKIPITLNPNPASDKIRLRLSADYPKATLRIQNIYGQMFHSEALDKLANEKTIDVSAYPAGIYLAIITASSGSGVAKFLVDR